MELRKSQYELALALLLVCSSCANNVLRRGRKMRSLEADRSIDCRMTILDTLYEVDGEATDRQEQLACIPISDGVELDEVYPIDGFVDIFDRYEDIVLEPSLFLRISDSSFTNETIFVSSYILDL